MSISQKSLFSIVTVVYNSENLIESTIKSVINQNFDKYEYIIIDGKSTDNTLKIVQKYKKNIDLILSEPDRGIYDAMNKSLQYVKGEFVLFLNSGDTLYDINTLKKVAAYYKRDNNLEYIYGAAEYLYDKYSIIFIPDFNSIRYGISPCHQASYVKTDLLKTLKFNTNYKSAADFDFFLRIYTKKPPIKYLQTKGILVKYLSGGFSADKKRSYSEIAQSLKINLPLIYYYIFVLNKIILEQGLKKILLTLRLKSVYQYLLRIKK
jgi:glycosyltransferase involved in cell wall biosynthesis